MEFSLISFTATRFGATATRFGSNPHCPLATGVLGWIRDWTYLECGVMRSSSSSHHHVLQSQCPSASCAVAASHKISGAVRLYLAFLSIELRGCQKVFISPQPGEGGFQGNLPHCYSDLII